MENNVQVWHQRAGAIFTAVLIYSIAGILTTLIGSIFPVSVGTTVGFKIFLTLLKVTNLVGLILFILVLGHFSAILDYDDSHSAGNVRTGAILNLIGVAVAFIPFVGWLGSILSIIGWIMMLIGYMSLKNSASFPAKARKGASSLFLAMIINLIGGVTMLIFGWIPLIRIIAGIIVFILYATAFILTLSGWISIRNADPNVT